MALQVTLEPIFEDLVYKDLKDWEPQLPQKSENNDQEQGQGQSRGGVPLWEKEYSEYEKHSPDQHDMEEVIEDLKKRIKQNKEEKKVKKETEKWDKMSPEKKQEQTAERKDMELEREHELRAGTLENLKEIQKELKQEIQTLSEFWKTLLHIYRTQSNRRTVGGRFESGIDVNIDALIDEMPRILTGDSENVRIFKRHIIKKNTISFPEKVNVRIIGDVSGSMDEGEKMSILEKSIVLLVSSLNKFQTQIKWQQGKPGAIKTKIDTQVWKYNDRIEEIKPFRADSAIDENVKLALALDTLHPDGGNNEALALHTVSDAVHKNSQYIQEIKNKKALDVIFLITDGGAYGVEEAKEEVESLLKTGVVVRAFQIGNVNTQEKETFNELWNEYDGGALGEIVGENVKELPQALSEALRTVIAGRMGSSV